MSGVVVSAVGTTVTGVLLVLIATGVLFRAKTVIKPKELPSDEL